MHLFCIQGLDGLESPTSPTKEKKSVSFADAQGLQLAFIRLITEPSDCPPKWSPDFLEQACLL